MPCDKSGNYTSMEKKDRHRSARARSGSLGQMASGFGGGATYSPCFARIAECGSITQAAKAYRNELQAALGCHRPHEQSWPAKAAGWSVLARRARAVVWFWFTP